MRIILCSFFIMISSVYLMSQAYERFTEDQAKKIISDADSLEKIGNYNGAILTLWELTKGIIDPKTPEGVPGLTSQASRKMEQLLGLLGPDSRLEVIRQLEANSQNKVIFLQLLNYIHQKIRQREYSEALYTALNAWKRHPNSPSLVELVYDIASDTSIWLSKTQALPSDAQSSTKWSYSPLLNYTLLESRRGNFQVLDASGQILHEIPSTDTTWFSADERFVFSLKRKDNALLAYEMGKLEREPEPSFKLEFESPPKSIEIWGKDQRIISLHENGQVAIWDRATQTRTYTIPSAAEHAIQKLYTNNDTLFALVRANHHVLIYGKSGQYLDSIVHQAPFAGLCFSRDHKLLTWNTHNELIFWSRKGAQRSTTFKRAISTAAFSPNAQYILVASGSNARSWDTTAFGSNLPRPDATYQHPGSITGIHIASNGETLLTYGSDQSIVLWTKSGRLIQHLKGHTDAIVQAVFSAKGGENTQILSLGKENQLRLWTLNGRAQKSLSLPEGHSLVWAVQPGKNDKNDIDFFTAGLDQRVIAWNAAAQTLDTLELDIQPRWLCSSSDTKWLAVATERQIRTYQYKDKGYVSKDTFNLDQQEDILDICFNDATIQILAARTKGQERELYFYANPKEEPILVKDSRQKSHPAIVFNAKNIVAAGDDDQIYFWEKPQRAPFSFQHRLGGKITHLSLSPQGDSLLASSSSGQVGLWRIKNGKEEEISSFGLFNEVSAAVFSNDRQRVITSSLDGTLRIWDANSTPLQNLYGHSAEPIGLQYLPRVGSFLSIQENGTLQIWDDFEAYLQRMSGKRLRHRAGSKIVEIKSKQKDKEPDESSTTSGIELDEDENEVKPAPNPPIVLVQKPQNLAIHQVLESKFRPENLKGGRKQPDEYPRDYLTIYIRNIKKLWLSDAPFVPSFQTLSADTVKFPVTTYTNFNNRSKEEKMVYFHFISFAQLLQGNYTEAQKTIQIGQTIEPNSVLLKLNACYFDLLANGKDQPLLEKYANLSKDYQDFVIQDIGYFKELGLGKTDLAKLIAELKKNMK